MAGDWEQKVQAKEKEQEPRECGEMWAEARAGSLFQEVLKGLDLCLPPQSPVAYAPTPQIQYTRAHRNMRRDACSCLLVGPSQPQAHVAEGKKGTRKYK